MAGGLSGTAEAFGRGWQTGWNIAGQARQEKLAAEDEKRRERAADLKEERESLRAQLATPGLSNEDRYRLQGLLEKNFTARDQLYDPIKAPGALQKDWDFLKGLVWRKGKRQAPPQVDASTTPEQTIALGDQTVSSFGATFDTSQIPAIASSITATPPAATAAPTTVPPELASKGMLQVGNIDVNHRPVIWNDDGTPSTIYATTVGLDANGKPWTGDYAKAPRYALIPTIANGKFLTPDGKMPVKGDQKAQQALTDAALDQYMKTGEHLGMFSSDAAANSYAEQRHGWMPNGGPEKVFVPSYTGHSNMPNTRPEYEEALKKTLQAQPQATTQVASNAPIAAPPTPIPNATFEEIRKAARPTPLPNATPAEAAAAQTPTPLTLTPAQARAGVTPPAPVTPPAAASALPPGMQALAAPPTASAAPAGAGPPGGAVTLPGGDIKIPGTPLPKVVGPPPPRTAYERKLAAQQEKARQEAEEYAAAIPPNAIDLGMKLYDHYFPKATEHDRQEHMMALVEAASGIKTSASNTKWVMKTAKTPDGKLISVMYNEKDPDGTMKYLSGEDIPPEVSSQLVIQGSGGKAAPGLVYKKDTNSVYDSKLDKYWHPDDPNLPPEAKALFIGAESVITRTQAYGKELAKERGESYNNSRRITVRDSRDGQIKIIKAGELDDPKNQGFMVPVSEYDKWGPRVNMLEDLRGSSRLLRQSIDRLKAEGQFDWEGKAKIAEAMSLAATDPDKALAAIRQVAASGILASLTPDQQDFMIRTQGLVEQAMGMRQLLGAGGGSEDVRDAITKTLPNLMAPTADFALNQLDYFNGTLERVHRVIPTNVTIGQSLPTGPWSVEDRQSPYADTAQLRDVLGTTLDPKGAPTPPDAIRNGTAVAGTPAGGAQTGGGTAQPRGRVGRSVGQVKAFLQQNPQKAQQLFGTPTPSDEQIAGYITQRGFQPTTP